MMYDYSMIITNICCVPVHIRPVGGYLVFVGFDYYVLLYYVLLFISMPPPPVIVPGMCLSYIEYSSIRTHKLYTRA